MVKTVSDGDQVSLPVRHTLFPTPVCDGNRTARRCRLRTLMTRRCNCAITARPTAARYGSIRARLTTNRRWPQGSTLRCREWQPSSSGSSSAARYARAFGREYVGRHGRGQPPAGCHCTYSAESGRRYRGHRREGVKRRRTRHSRILQPPRDAGPAFQPRRRCARATRHCSLRAKSMRQPVKNPIEGSKRPPLPALMSRSSEAAFNSLKRPRHGALLGAGILKPPGLTMVNQRGSGNSRIPPSPPVTLPQRKRGQCFLIPGNNGHSCCSIA